MENIKVNTEMTVEEIGNEIIKSKSFKKFTEGLKIFSPFVRRKTVYVDSYIKDVISIVKEQLKELDNSFYVELYIRLQLILMNEIRIAIIEKEYDYE